MSTRVRLPGVSQDDLDWAVEQMSNCTLLCFPPFIPNAAVRASVKKRGISTEFPIGPIRQQDVLSYTDGEIHSAFLTVCTSLKAERMLTRCDDVLAEAAQWSLSNATRFLPIAEKFKLRKTKNRCIATIALHIDDPADDRDIVWMMQLSDEAINAILREARNL